MTALEIYRITDEGTSAKELINEQPNPEKGSTCRFVDENPQLNKMNYYLVKCVSLFGSTELRVQAFVGFDVPSAPYPVVGEALAEGDTVFPGQHLPQVSTMAQSTLTKRSITCIVAGDGQKMSVR